MYWELLGRGLARGPIINDSAALRWTPQSKNQFLNKLLWHWGKDSLRASEISTLIPSSRLNLSGCLGNWAFTCFDKNK